jgi:hypothetical protein
LPTLWWIVQIDVTAAWGWGHEGCAVGNYGLLPPAPGTMVACMALVYAAMRSGFLLFFSRLRPKLALALAMMLAAVVCRWHSCLHVRSGMVVPTDGSQGLVGAAELLLHAADVKVSFSFLLNI